MSAKWDEEFPSILRSHRERTMLRWMKPGRLRCQWNRSRAGTAGESLPSLPEYFSLAEVFGWPIPEAFVSKGLAGDERRLSPCSPA